MLITIFLDYPNNIACLRKPSLRDLMDDMINATPLTEEQLLDTLSESLATILRFNQEEGSWERLFKLMEPKKFNENGELEPTTGSISEEQRAELKEGALNFAAEMKVLYPEIYTKIEELIKSASQLSEFAIAIAEAQDNPELAELLNPTKEEA